MEALVTGGAGSTDNPNYSSVYGPCHIAAPPLLLFRYHRVMDISKIKRQTGYWHVVPVEKALELL